jgi:Ca-activated chloride channel homolog
MRRAICGYGFEPRRFSYLGRRSATTTTSFLHQDQPVSLGILVDNSGSMLDKRAAVNAAALNLLRASNPQDSTFIVNFSDRAFLDQGFTSDIGALNRGLSHFDSKGTTALYDAVAASADELARHGKLPKQVLLVITDGADNASRLELEQAIRRVQNLGGPVVYTIGLLFGADKDESERARSALEKLSAGDGRHRLLSAFLEDVDSIAAGGRARYSGPVHHRLSLHQAASWKATELYASRRAAPKHGKLIVRTRKGYYAKKPAPQHTQTAQEVNPLIRLARLSGRSGVWGFSAFRPWNRNIENSWS